MHIASLMFYGHHGKFWGLWSMAAWLVNIHSFETSFIINTDMYAQACFNAILKKFTGASLGFTRAVENN